MIQCNAVANFSQIAQLMDAPNDIILSKKYLPWNLNPSRSKSCFATGMSRVADFISDLSYEVPAPSVARMAAASSTDAYCTEHAAGSIKGLID